MRDLRKRAVWTACLMASSVICAGCTIWGHRPKAEPGSVHQFASERFRAEVVAERLHVPWSLAWMPDGRLLVTQRSGEIMAIQSGNTTPQQLAVVPEVKEVTEGGLMALALSPNFAQDRLIYISYTMRRAGGGKKNVIVRYRLENNQLADRTVLVDDLPAAPHHDGLPMHFGPDGRLYASTGDAQRRDLPQRADSLAGKFLRMNPDGSPPQDNPFAGSLVWSLGHRNSQGFDWQPGTGRLYEVEHGPTFPLDGLSGADEVNLIVRGGNYGWPRYYADHSPPEYEAPLWQSGLDAIAPAQATFYRGDRFAAWKGAFLFATLHGESLYVVKFSMQDPRKIESMARGLQQQFGRLRVVAEGPDGCVYLATSNRDGHGLPASQDDRIWRLVPLEQ